MKINKVIAYLMVAILTPNSWARSFNDIRRFPFAMTYSIDN